MSRLAIIFTVCLAIMAMTLPVFAQDNRPCAGDAATFCAGQQRGQIISCLGENEAQLSPVCRQHIDRMNKLKTEVQQACAGDIDTFCGGGGPVMKCLRSNRAQLSEECRSALHQIRRTWRHRGSAE